MLWIDPGAVPPLRANAADGGWTIVDARTVDVLRSTAALPRLSRAEAERLIAAGLARPGEVVPPMFIPKPENSP